MEGCHPHRNRHHHRHRRPPRRRRHRRHPLHGRHDRCSSHDEHEHISCSICIDLHCFLAPPSLVPSRHSFLRRHHCFRERFLPTLPVPLALLLCCACAPPVSHAFFFFSPDTRVPLHAGRTCSPCLRDDAL
ncbi:hypothetical protein BU14_0525s0001 [Porphyra umbilicalis]|uniref:Uncharacterized protein n=1 Tax=Porphyra umbilicalis TaxID=2786 RepID=A0A1X6NSZ7_PORUM|nr:hypothetical protein BU14_0525s0001 [Porphyra umbilicalis]|eukprot:OSX71513.1 hypothetical protein BU14_0525s0001 [Porphyra umbilicalis]